MDVIDNLLLDAWNRIGDKVRADRLMALRRSRRRFGVLARPMRAWCLCLRASDTRINDYSAIIEAAPEAEFSRNPIESHQPHIVTLDGKLIRRLTAPVKIPWPGVDLQQAADMLGRDYQTIAYWAYHGVFRREYYKRTRQPKVSAPVLWTPSPIDPNAPRGRPPHAVWGTLWQWMHESFPEDYQLTVKRVPRFRFDRGSNRFHGWYFICPGRLARAGEFTTEITENTERQRMDSARALPPSLEGGGQGVGEGNGVRSIVETSPSRPITHIPCGRRTNYLYGPQSVWTLAQALSDDRGFDMPPPPPHENCGLAGQWFPGAAGSDPIKATGPRSFACNHCWKVRNQSWADGTGWNEFVSHISGGLLYGHDVPRPLDLVPIERKNEYRAKPHKGTPRKKHDDAKAIAEAIERTRKRKPRKDKGIKRGPQAKPRQTQADRMKITPKAKESGRKVA